MGAASACETQLVECEQMEWFRLKLSLATPMLVALTFVTLCLFLG